MKNRLVIILLIVYSQVGSVYSFTSENENLIEYTRKKIEQTLTQNKINDSLGRSDMNNYIINISSQNYVTFKKTNNTDLNPNKEVISADVLRELNTLLKEVNVLTELKVYVFYIDGLLLSQDNGIPDNINDISEIVDWQYDREEANTFSTNSAIEATKEVVERFSAVTSKNFTNESAFFSLVNAYTYYGLNNVNKVTCYHSTSKNFDDPSMLLQPINKAVAEAFKEKTFGEYSRNNLEALVRLVRQHTDEYIVTLSNGKTISQQIIEKDGVGWSAYVEIVKKVNELTEKELFTITLDARKLFLKKVLELPLTDNANLLGYKKVDLEALILRVLEYVPLNDIDQFHKILSETKLGKDESGESMINVLLTQIDDSFWFIGDDNYTALVKLFSKQLKNSPSYNKKIEMLYKSDWEHYKSRLILWDNDEILQFMKKKPIGHNTFDVEFVLGSHFIQYTKTTVIGYRCSRDDIVKFYLSQMLSFIDFDGCSEEIPYESEPVNLEPFEPIMFVNRSSLETLSDVQANPLNFEAVPALVLEYAEDKRFNDNAVTSAEIAFEVATIAIPIGKIRHLGTFGKLVYSHELYSKLVSGLNLTYHAYGKEHGDVLIAMNMADLLFSGYRGGRFARDFYKNVKYKRELQGHMANYTLAMRKVKENGGLHKIVERAETGNVEELAMLEMWQKLEIDGQRLLGKDWAESLATMSFELSYNNIFVLLNRIENHKQLFDDINANQKLMDALRMANAEELSVLVKTWEKAFQAGIGPALRTNPEALKKMKNWDCNK